MFFLALLFNIKVRVSSGVLSIIHRVGVRFHFQISSHSLCPWEWFGQLIDSSSKSYVAQTTRDCVTFDLFSRSILALGGSREIPRLSTSTLDVSPQHVKKKKEEQFDLGNHSGDTTIIQLNS